MTLDRWAAASQGLTEVVDEFSERDDLVVRVCENASAPGTFSPRRAEITLDASVVLPGVNPDAEDFASAVLLLKFPVLAGVLAHEVAHAEHSVARASENVMVDGWAQVLEEPRIERAAISDRPYVRGWLRSAVTALIATDATDAVSAAEVLVLVGGRIAAGVFSHGEIDIDAVCRDWLTAEQFFVVSDAVLTAVGLADSDVEALFVQAERIARVLGGRRPAHLPHAGDENASELDGDALARQLAEIAEEAAGEITLPEELATVANATGAGYSEHLVEHRMPTSDERRAERQLLLRLRRAADRGGDVREVPTRLPSGRLVTGELVQRSAQRAMGVMPTATPWRERTRRVRPRPRLTIGIAADISYSQEAVMESVGVVTWLLSRAARDRGGRSLSLIWDDEVSVLEGGGGATVPIPLAAGGSGGLPKALRMLDERLSLVADTRQPRLVAVITDGYLWPEDTVIAELRRLLDAGVRVLWLDTGAGDGIVPPNGTVVTRIGEGGDLTALIAEGAIVALTAARALRTPW
ncbi:hypothetical protein [Tsukamurella spumae]|uniref:VWA domain-containing protein n=1 Tax=Tsukamurella spumae TaxID=44753 RepID=A0A846WXE7_9ACTN|nr:hypothetical protein [Tsukamurella spumae]NKY17877.1 hypothetical protein [Tsukamurella spumae]